MTDRVQPSLFLGVDGGGSKTAAVVVDPGLTILGEGIAGPSNHLRVGIEEATAELRRAIMQACTAAGTRPEAIEYVYCGIAGADHPRHRAALVEAMRTLFPRDNFTIDSDARIALTGAIGHGSGIVVVAGTGSVAFGRNSAGNEARAGGWGPTLGDEGSGYSIARHGLSAIVRAFDGRGDATLMTDLLCDRYGMCQPDELPYFVYAPSTHANDIAAYCKLVIDAARRGDAVARAIFEAEGEELAVTVLAVARALGILREGFPVAWVGGAFAAGPLLLDPLASRLHHEAPGARLQQPVESPLIGAARMAIRAPRRT